MSKQETVEFALSGTVAGKPISAREGVPFVRFTEFNEEVQKYVQGSDVKAVLNDLQVQIEEGSYLLRLIIPAGLLLSLLSDTAKVAKSGSLVDIDPNRARVVLGWQARAKAEKTLAYMVRSPDGSFEPVQITQASSYTREEKEQWVRIERYLIGEIEDWGGSKNVNVHIRPRNSRDAIIITANADQIRKQKDNLVFHKAVVHVEAKQNPKTGELKDYRLLELQAYGPNVEEARLQELFAKGAAAWSGVPDAGAWVEGLRGGANA
jgi:hypothetical protein